MTALLDNTSAKFTATFSPEDNKLRLRISIWMDGEHYKIIKDMGFRYAPIQEYVYAAWSPERESFCLALAGCITPEQITLVERAEAKAERLDNLAVKRANEANSYQLAAQQIAENFNGQPILAGHHSERSARRDQNKMESLAEKAEHALSAIDYWGYRAEGVERFANRKADPTVRAGRIKTLLKDLRDKQKIINDCNLNLNLWEKINGIKDDVNKKALVQKYIGVQIMAGGSTTYNLHRAFSDGEITAQQAIDKKIEYCQKNINSESLARWISHILNRLGYEHNELGAVSRFDGEITAAVLQVFLREHGAYKPKGSKAGDEWLVSSKVSFPAHIGAGEKILLSADAWRDLMQSVGYEVPYAKPKKAPILNFKAETLKVKLWSSIHELKQLEMTKSELKDIYHEYRGVAYSECKKFRVKVCKDPSDTGPGYKARWVVVFLTDSKVHGAPESLLNSVDEAEAA